VDDALSSTRSVENNIFGESMEVFHRAADLIGLAPRVRLELEQPDFEHIFYITAHLEDRLVPMAPAEAAAVSSSGPRRCARGRFTSGMA